MTTGEVLSRGPGLHIVINFIKMCFFVLHSFNKIIVSMFNYRIINKLTYLLTFKKQFLASTNIFTFI